MWSRYADTMRVIRCRSRFRSAVGMSSSVQCRSLVLNAQCNGRVRLLSAIVALNWTARAGYGSCRAAVSSGDAPGRRSATQYDECDSGGTAAEDDG